MAAKVALVAVPTVLGIASIRVYTVSEAPTDGVRREKLNIYTPLPPPAQVKFLPESPGAIENGLTTVREGVLPAYQAVKGAGVSVKTGTINLYHAGQDVFYYLKDPPPDFLPRFGTITMAGLLGMFLTRKGSHLKKFAVPLGLMSAGASVCYPAQAVAVCKVTGKKLYAAGQWSSAAVSSLFTSKEPAAKDLLASQPQSAPVPGSAPDLSPPTETKAQSATIPETEVESAESAPVSDEPVSAVITEEESSAALAEISPDPVPTETGSGPSEGPTPPASTEAAKQTAEEASADISSAEAAGSSEATEAAPALSAPAESAPVDSAPAESAPVESAPVESAPTETGPAESAPVDAASAESAPPPEESAPDAPEQPAGAESAEPLTPPPEEELTADKSKEGSSFKPDPSLVDFGQSSPEDADLYTTRS
ncbi:MICOS complex subunit MIC27 isoform X2 [Salarias fasciatus]|uniref:MICOS complex subunit MIC27 isoform X2 n=1 Tax=Salarias fasciatus TaxID=181472 RepID=UPI00117707EB|nr:MICOS complex subunit MIC27-like isoform X2 [Salarias fasciatus]